MRKGLYPAGKVWLLDSHPARNSVNPTMEAEMVEIVFLVDKDPKGRFAARALDEAIFTEADTVEELHVSVRDAVNCHFDEGQAPKVIWLRFVRDTRLCA